MAFAMPAKKGTITYTMANGEKIEVNLHGDEHHHFYTTTDGYVLLRNANGDFTYARTEKSKLVDTYVRATNIDRRTSEVKSMLLNIDRDASLKVQELNRKEVMQKRLHVLRQRLPTSMKAS